MKSLFRLPLLLPALFLALAFSSCETTPDPGPQPNPKPDDHEHDHDLDDPEPRPAKVSWSLHPDGAGYDLDLMVNGQEHHIDRGSEYVHAHRVTGADVPADALSAYEVDMPDGEAMLYWVEQQGGRLVAYSRFWDPIDSRFDAPKRIKSIRL